MQHFIVYAILSILIFTYIGQNTLPSNYEGEGFFAQATTVATAAVLKTSVNTDVVEEIVEKDGMTVGVVMSSTPDLTMARLKNAIQVVVDGTASTHFTDTLGDLSMQMENMDKMIELGYDYLIVEISSDAEAPYLVKLAGESGIPTLFLGVMPEIEQLTAYDNLYYVGFDDSGMAKVLAEEMRKAFFHPVVPINFTRDSDKDINYATVTDLPLDINEVFETYLFENLVVAECYGTVVLDGRPIDGVGDIRDLYFDGNEVLFLSDSESVEEVLDFFYNPMYFYKRPTMNLIVTSIDSKVEALVESGEVIIACGKDYNQLGEIAGEIIHAHINDQTPILDYPNIENIYDRCYIVGERVIRSFDDTEFDESIWQSAITRRAALITDQNPESTVTSGDDD